MTYSGTLDKQEARWKARVIAFYLPQFHPIPENDAWWGKGFTEWTNVRKAEPLFPGHYQPRVPADLGYYDLRNPETRLAQAELARAYGVEGFCYWHYWFAGERFMERPFDHVLESEEPDLRFCLAWANESWRGVWVGAPRRILKVQTYPGLEDHRAHLLALLKAFTDPRYITVEGKPLFVVYKPKQLPDALLVTDLWRELALQAGLKGLYLVATEQDQRWNPGAHGFDAVTLCYQTRVISAPLISPRTLRRAVLSDDWVAALYKRIRRRPLYVYRYAQALPYFIVDRRLSFEYYPCVVPGWDNTPRAGLDGIVLHEATPELFEQQVRRAVQRVADLPPERRLVFAKSWNEWAEGNYLEPDQRHGHGYLRALRDAIAM